jgi:SpoVK/Ycf46/Vps4 family AAA+-type ATPase
VKDELSALIRARAGVVWLVSNEEVRVERACQEVGVSLGMTVYAWRFSTGISKLGVGGEEPAQIPTRSPQSEGGQQRVVAVQGAQCFDPVRALEVIRDSSERSMFLLEDITFAMKNPAVRRRLRDLIRSLPSLPPDRAKAIIVIDPSPPPEALPGLTVIDFPLPDREEMARIVADIAAATTGEIRADLQAQQEAVVEALTGLEAEVAASALGRCLVAEKRVNVTRLVAAKKDLLKSEALEWFDPDPRGLDGVGGLDNLKRWLLQRRRAFSPEAREYGLPAPRGCLVAGIPGTGKSLTAKCVASAWTLPLLRFDVGAVFGKYVGESERRIREALRTAKAVAQCILWVDELEKAFAGVGSDSTDGGTSSRVFGTFLTWLQENDAGIFVIATTNDPRRLPPEFTRAGRFDAIWWVDLPTARERRAIVEVMRRKYPRCAAVDTEAVADATSGLTGAEIEEAIRGALNVAFGEDRDPTTEDVIQAASEIVPVTRSYGDRLAELRKWARAGARPASPPEEESEAASANGGRQWEL